MAVGGHSPEPAVSPSVCLQRTRKWPSDPTPTLVEDPVLRCAVQKAPGELPDPHKMLVGQRQSQSGCSGPCEVETTVSKTQTLAQWPVSEGLGDDGLPLIVVLTAEQLKVGSQKTQSLLSKQHICLQLGFPLPQKSRLRRLAKPFRPQNVPPNSSWELIRGVKRACRRGCSQRSCPQLRCCRSPFPQQVRR